MKLSPNLRKPTKEFKAALISGETPTPVKFEIKKLEMILTMVTEPDDNIEETFDEEEGDTLI